MIFYPVEVLYLTKDFDGERAHSVFREMIHVDRMHRCVVERFLVAFGIHRSQHMTLMYLSRQEDCPSQKQIAEHFRISPASVAVTLKKLEEAGYIERESSEDDSRFNNIKITAKGRNIIDKSKELFEETDYEMFSSFTEEDYEAFRKCLEKMTSGLTAYSEKLDDIIKDKLQ